MTIQLHDTLQGRKVPFEPLVEGEVTMYLCGPTVYNYAHIGNARPAVVFDLLARVLRRSLSSHRFLLSAFLITKTSGCLMA